MTTREEAPKGAPCWTDLSTSDVDGSRRFYAELLGWEAAEPSDEFGGYWMFMREGVPVAGGMGPMGDMPGRNVWQTYLSTDDITKTAESATAEGAQIISPVMAVADLGQQLIMLDPTGALIGSWQPGTFPGFTVLDVHGAPSWFELHTTQHAQAVSFYRDIFGVETKSMGDSDEFRYTTLVDAAGTELAGIMDSSSFLAGQPYWAVYWEVDDCRASASKVQALGGSIVEPAQDTPYGCIAAVADPAGAQFRLRTKP